MARYFKYKSAQDLIEDARSLGGDLTVSDRLDALFQPLEIGTLTAKNRLAVQPMEGCDGTLDGHPDELTYRRYHRFGAGGAAVIWGEATAITDEGRMNPRQLCLTDETVPSIKKMIDECRAFHRESCGSDDGLLIGLQLTHSGRFSYRKPLRVTNDPLLDPLTFDKTLNRAVGANDPLLTDNDLRQLEERYIDAAYMALECGVDFIDLKQCHRYLLSELLGAKNREGDYGGSYENRTRFIRDIVRRIRAELPDLVIATRMNAYDGIPYRGAGEEFIGEPVPHELPLVNGFGMNPDDHLQEDLTEPIRLVQDLREWGVDLINVSMGNPYANPHVIRPAEFPPVDGYHAPEHPLLGVLRHLRITGALQRAVPDVPIMGSGYSWLQDYALHVGAANIERGDVSLIGMGRATLSHPDFAAFAQRTGHMNRKQICRTFSYCTNLMRTKDHPLGQYPTGCPPFDTEVYGPLWKEAEARRKQSD
ncbi:MAG TPA: NADH:flavin oxidoreductase [Planctomycetaceae bacterium]|nr:NADH:flavin oxidoreductase [Planctomycetaceae bacterium]